MYRFSSEAELALNVSVVTLIVLSHLSKLSQLIQYSDYFSVTELHMSLSVFSLVTCIFRGS